MKIVVLSGAGMSAESGIQTFRDAGGLWESYKIEDVATPEAWQRNPKMVLDFYNQRRRQLKEVQPNAGHLLIASWEKLHDIEVITQNVDNLHERAGSSSVLHLHGELTKARSTLYPERIYDWDGDLYLGDVCDKKTQLRPHIVWFGEEVPAIHTAVSLVENADCVVIVGTSMQVYPAASLYQYAPHRCPIYYIDPNPGYIPDSFHHKIILIKEIASTGLSIINDKLMDNTIEYYKY
jgi:NAD-dependent deacetylase